jgi:very-short-patch-repair endonuclease
VPDDWLHDRAKEMRQSPPVQERRLWKLLRDRRLGGLKFRRQVVIGRYVADFVCMRHRLIVEADGPHHAESAERDAARDAWLSGQRFRVLRFPNSQIETRAHEVIAAILAATGRSLTGPAWETPHPSRYASHLLPQGEKDDVAPTPRSGRNPRRGP